MQPGVHAAAPVGVVDAGSWVEAGRRGGGGGQGQEGPSIASCQSKKQKMNHGLLKYDIPIFHTGAKKQTTKAKPSWGRCDGWPPHL